MSLGPILLAVAAGLALLCVLTFVVVVLVLMAVPRLRWLKDLLIDDRGRSCE